jgi:hypothetical protein
MKTNHKAVWLVVLIAQIMPAIWYGLFVDAYLSLNHLTMEDTAHPIAYLVSIVSATTLTYMLSYIYGRMNIVSAIDGAKTALIIGFPIYILGLITWNLFSLRPYALAWLDGGVNLIILIIAGAIIGGWHKK